LITDYNLIIDLLKIPHIKPKNLGMGRDTTQHIIFMIYIKCVYLATTHTKFMDLATILTKHRLDDDSY